MTTVAAVIIARNVTGYFRIVLAPSRPLSSTSLIGRIRRGQAGHRNQLVPYPVSSPETSPAFAGCSPRRSYSWDQLVGRRTHAALRTRACTWRSLSRSGATVGRVAVSNGRSLQASLSIAAQLSHRNV